MLSAVSGSLKKFFIKRTTKSKIVKHSSSDSDSDEGTTQRAAGLPPVDLLLKHIEMVKKTND